MKKKPSPWEPAARGELASGSQKDNMTKEQKLGRHMQLEEDMAEAKPIKEAIRLATESMEPEVRKATMRRFAMEEDENFDFLRKNYPALFREAFPIQ